MISNLAYVHPDAKIGNNVTIEAFAYVAGNVVIGDDSYLAPHAVVLDGARLGKGCKVHSGAVVSGIPQDLKFKGEETLAIIGDNTTIRESVTINRGTAAKGKTVIGNNCLIMAYAHVAHDCIVGNNVIIVNSVSVAGEVEIGDFAILGGHSAVHQFVKIGRHAMIAGGALLGKDVPPYVTAGHLVAEYKGLNSIGLKRRGFTSSDITSIQDIYRILMCEGINVSQAVEQVEKEIEESKFKTEILAFVKSSKRGILR
ncbi:MAG: acyl-ACP--UDP-N-acetylglucosamine O-acyltransferase [Bacteroidetes bacterium]|nr:acyl-ACP--UDP-N-acetylglucosamine O-acyltransferase [Bacteroidota bacterium]